MGPGEWIVIGLCIVLVAWFVAGSYLNDQKMQRASRWARDGLKKYGTLGALRRMDPSSIGMRLMPEGKKPPFPQLEVLINLVRRENFPLFVYQTLRRKSDLLIIKANFVSSPKSEAHILLKNDTALLDRLNAADSQPLMMRFEDADHRLYYRGDLDEATETSLKSFLAQYPGCIQRLSLQAKAPHLTLNACITPLASVQGEPFFQALSEL